MMHTSNLIIHMNIIYHPYLHIIPNLSTLNPLISAVHLIFFKNPPSKDHKVRYVSAKKLLLLEL